MNYVAQNPLTVVSTMTVFGVLITLAAVWATWQTVDRAVDRAMADYERRIDDMTVRRAADHDETERLQDRLHMALGRVQRLQAQLVVILDQLAAAGLKPAFSEDPVRAAVAYVNEAVLARQIGRRFDVDGVRALAFDLGFDYDNLSGNTKDGQIQSLVVMARHRNRMVDLLKLLDRERPNEIWY